MRRAAFGIRERFIEQDDLRLPDNRPTDGSALALCTGKLAGTAVEKVFHLQDTGGLGNLFVLFRLGSPGDGQAKRDVFAQGLMREDGLALEGHGKAAILGWQLVHAFAVDR